MPPARDEWRSSHSALLDFGDFLAGDVAEDQKVGQGVAAEAIAAVDAARDLTCGVEARDHVAVLVEDLGLLVDAKTAHRVVDGRRTAPSRPDCR